MPPKRSKQNKKQNKSGSYPPKKRGNKKSAPRPPPSNPPAASSSSAGPFSTVGRALGSIFGDTGASIGSAAGSIIGSIFGMGAYKVKKNSIMLASNGPPSFAGMGDGSVILSKREFITDVFGSTNFLIQTYNINPGLSNAFPWLSTVADSFQTYEMLGLVYEFKSTSAVAVNSTNTALGTVIMATNYDVLNPAFQNKQQMEAYEFATSSSPAISFYHPVECNPKMNVLGQMYLRSGAAPPLSDSRFYDLGLFQIATVGMQAAANIGELWVTYHVKLCKPKIATPIGVNGVFAHLVSTGAATATAANPGGSGGFSAKAGSTMQFAVVSAGSTGLSSTQFTMLYPGTFIVFVSFNSATISASPTITRGANISLGATLFVNSATASLSGVQTNSQAFLAVIVNVSQGFSGSLADSLLTVGGGGTYTGGNTDIVISQLANSLTKPLSVVVGKEEEKVTTSDEFDRCEVIDELSSLSPTIRRQLISVLSSSSSSSK